MTLPIRLLPKAKDEFDAAADWYEQRRPGLGIDFMVRVGEVFRRAQWPKYQRTSGLTR
jgi:hypothetical protein